MSHSKYPPVYVSLPIVCITRIHKGETTGKGKYYALARVLYNTLARALKLFISVVQCLGKGPGIFISLVCIYTPAITGTLFYSCVFITCIVATSTANTIMETLYYS